MSEKIVKCETCGEEYVTAGMTEQIMPTCPECRGKPEKYSLGLISLQAD